MSATPNRLELLVDVFEQKQQRALALPDLTPSQLVQAVLQEFRELEYLSDIPENYVLFKAEDKSQLVDDRPLQEQVAPGSRLVLVETRPTLPEGTRRPSQHLYLREQTSGKVYKLHWVPAIIGRPDPNQPHDDWIAVNLESYQTGLRVSRRHAMITETDGQYFVESMSRNPTLLKTPDGELIPVGEEKHPLNPGDTIVLERSSISLKFIVR
ncbi:MAG: FHA domain-containing protein [Chloroflexi bacterium]|nr:MAG: FHA domain-containing protein [Chloroflexota bacterium]